MTLGYKAYSHEVMVSHEIYVVLIYANLSVSSASCGVTEIDWRDFEDHEPVLPKNPIREIKIIREPQMHDVNVSYNLQMTVASSQFLEGT